jgi:ubiquinone/menaquinone biosynthesis C-methylase UbiE
MTLSPLATGRFVLCFFVAALAVANSPCQVRASGLSARSKSAHIFAGDGSTSLSRNFLAFLEDENVTTTEKNGDGPSVHISSSAASSTLTSAANGGRDTNDAKDNFVVHMEVCSWSSMDYCSAADFAEKLKSMQLSSKVFSPVEENLIDMLSPVSGERLLGVGIGDGSTLFRVARSMSGGGLVMGVDNSDKMLKVAEQSYREHSPNPRVVVMFRKGRVEELNRDIESKFQGTFSGVMMKRVLVHNGQAERAIGQLTRMVRAGGRVVVAEPDWFSLKFDHPDRVTTIQVQKLFESRTSSPTVGRSLRRTFRKVGLKSLVLRAVPIIMTKPADIELEKNINEFVEEGLLEKRTAKTWLDASMKLAKEGAFLCTLTSYIVRGIRPDTPLKPLADYTAAVQRSSVGGLVTSAAVVDDEPVKSYLSGHDQNRGVVDRAGVGKDEVGGRSRGEEEYDKHQLRPLHDRDRDGDDYDEEEEKDEEYDDGEYYDDNGEEDYDAEEEDDRYARYHRRSNHRSGRHSSRHGRRGGHRRTRRRRAPRRHHAHLRSNGRRHIASPLNAPKPMGIQQARSMPIQHAEMKMPEKTKNSLGVNEFKLVGFGSPPTKSKERSSHHSVDATRQSNGREGRSQTGLRKTAGSTNGGGGVNRDSGVIDGDLDENAGVVQLH